MRETATADDRLHEDPEPYIKVAALGDSSVDFVLRAWCDSDDYWVLHHDLTRAVKDAFDRNDIEIPFPSVSLYRKDQESS